MGTVTYKKQQSAAAALKAGVPLAGTSHVYKVNSVLWPEAVASFIETILIPKTLHVCCGKSTIGDLRVDLFDETADVKMDAAKMDFKDNSFETVLCDPPYNGKMQWNHDLLCELSRIASKRIIFQHWFIPADPYGQWKKFNEFRLKDIFVWQPKTYFGRVNVISVFDRESAQSDKGR